MFDPPDLDEELRARLRRRYGSAIDPWLDALPPVLRTLADRWAIEWGSLIQRGSMSVVIRCVADGGRPAVLKLSPDVARIGYEARALATWATPHVPAVLAVDEDAGGLMIEAIEPGTPLAETAEYPSIGTIGALLTSLHAGAEADRSYPSVVDHIIHLFNASARMYEWRPDFVNLVSRDAYERSRKLALRLADEAGSRVRLHGDPTPANVLDGGDRGLVAVDPSPCIGDPAFDAIDLLLWRADSEDMLVSRVVELAPLIDVDSGRLLDWCVAFAGMNALEIAEKSGSFDEDVGALLSLAARA